MAMRSCQGAPSNEHLAFGTDEIPQFPAHKVKRSAAIICSRHPTQKILPASRSEPARYVHERKAVSDYWQGDDLIPKTGGSPSVPLKSFDSLCWASLGSFSISISHDRASQPDSGEKPQAQVLPAFFHLESTNFVAKSTLDIILSLSMLQDAIEEMLEETNVDIVDFVACDSMYKCSYHQGNRFISFLVRVFEPPTKSSGQLLDTDGFVAENIEGGFLVELQLQQGDRLHFSGLFRDMLWNFTKSQNDIAPTGTLRYKSRPFPEKGEGLVLERTASLEKTSRLSMRQPKEYASELPSQTSSGPMDEDMMEDVFKLVEALETGFLDVQTDAATAIAALTSDAGFRDQLSDPRAKKAADALCCASARLLAETEHRPARRQAAVTVANLASTPALCRSLLDSDPPLTSPKRGIVDSLVTLAMLRSKEKEEEEIGTRRECMRALIGLAESRSTRNMRAMRLLLSATPSGGGAKCKKLSQRLRACKEVLIRPATLA
ncbi:unnamed protein product [Ascophyllum nodosum]